MDLGFSGKLAVVTGSTMGIGKAIAKTLSEEGAKVVVNGRSQNTVDATLEELKLGDRAVGVAADVGTSDGCARLIEVAQKSGTIDILINNAGIFEPKPFADIPDEDWQKFFDVNVMSGIRLSRAVAQPMTDKGWGRIVFIASESAINIPVEMVHYGMTKTAQLAVSRGLAKSLKATGVTVNSVLPGPTWSEGVAEFVKEIAAGRNLDETKRDFFREVRPTSLTQRFGTVQEVAATVAFLCSQQAATTTGAAVRCDGGIVDTCF